MGGEINRRTMLVAAPFGILISAGSRVPSTGPLFVLVEQDPWAMVLGADSPTFALYGDGAVIYRKGEGYRSAKLSREELDRLIAEFNLTALARFEKHYNAVSRTDAPTEVVFMFRAGKRSVISVYGSLGASDVRAKVPPKVVSAYDRARAFDHPKAQPWIPDKIEVMIWPYDYAPEASIVWPKEWPGLDDASTIRRSRDAYSIYLPGAEYPKLRKFLATRREKSAVQIGAKKWAASVRFPFPNEQSWMTHAPNGAP